MEIKEVEVTKLNLQPGDVLAVTIKDPEVDYDSLGNLREMLETVFPNNKVMAFAIGKDSEIRFTSVKDNSQLQEMPQCGTSSYCEGCNCGKREAAEKVLTPEENGDTN